MLGDVISSDCDRVELLEIWPSRNFPWAVAFLILLSVPKLLTIQPETVVGAIKGLLRGLWHDQEALQGFAKQMGRGLQGELKLLRGTNGQS